jgi:hypothetical protein
MMAATCSRRPGSTTLSGRALSTDGSVRPRGDMRPILLARFGTGRGEKLDGSTPPVQARASARGYYCARNSVS